MYRSLWNPYTCVRPLRHRTALFPMNAQNGVTQLHKHCYVGHDVTSHCRSSQTARAGSATKTPLHRSPAAWALTTTLHCPHTLRLRPSHGNQTQNRRRARAPFDRVGCGASGCGQPHRNLPGPLHKISAAASIGPSKIRNASLAVQPVYMRTELHSFTSTATWVTTSRRSVVVLKPLGPGPLLKLRFIARPPHGR